MMAAEGHSNTSDTRFFNARVLILKIIIKFSVVVF
jgi:hypothetical protein